MGDSFAAAMDALDRVQDRPAEYCDVFVDVFPISGVAVSTVGDVLGSETLAASDKRAARLDELQFDLGEGPCWDAVRSGNAILQPEILVTGRTLWPAFTESIADVGISSVFAFPLGVGPLRFGAIDLYSDEPVVLDDSQARQAGAMAEVVGRQVLRRALTADGLEPVNGFSRRLVHQASGMVLAQIDISADDARLVIQGHAFAMDRSMMDVAQDIIDGRLSFTRSGARIEVDE